MTKFRIGLSRDVADAAGKPTFDPIALRVLDDDPRLEWEWFGDGVSEVTTRDIFTYDGICLGGPPVRASCLGATDARTRIIARFGVGYDHCDVPAMTKHGVLLTINPDGVRRAVATGILGFLLALAHRIPTLDGLVRRNGWRDRRDHVGTGLAGRTLGLIGVGNIGRDLFRIARPLEMRHIAYDPFATAAEEVTLEAFDAVVAQADFLVVCCPLNESTCGLIGKRALSLMKPTAFLINAARGAIVDEAALIRALRSRRIAGAAIDVFEQEPTPPDNELLTLDNVILSPHTLAYTDESLRLMAEGAFRSVADFFNRRQPNKIVNTELLATPALAGWFAAP